MQNDFFYDEQIKYAKGHYGLTMFFSSLLINKCIEIFNKDNIENATFAHSYLNDGFNEKDLNILTEISAKRIIINPSEITDFTGLYSQERLILLRIMSDPIKGEIDFAKLNKLESFEGYYTQNLKNLFSCRSLKVLWLWKYKSSTGDLSEFAGLENLEELHIIQSNIKSCKGIEGLKKLKTIGLAYNRNLVFFTNEEPHYQLNEMEIEVCKKLDLATLKGVSNLRTLKIINNGKIATLEPVLKQLPSLEKLQFTESELTDSDNSYLLQQPSLKDVWLSDKKHYRFKTKEIREALTNR